MEQRMPSRDHPNTSKTEADWLRIMADFQAGTPDAEIARREGLSPATVASQRAKRGVYRRDHPRGAGRTGATTPKRRAKLAPPPLALPPGADAGATAAALVAHGLRLTEAGQLADAAAVLRLARAFEAAAGRRAGTGGFAPEAAAAPVLRAAQRAPEGDWSTWLFLGGRGAGKTLAGAAWLADAAKGSERLAVVAPTLGDAREVMVDGPSGLRGRAAAFGPEGKAPAYEPSRRRLLWANGAVGMVFSAEDPDGLRGPQFGAAWADELCAWARPEATLSNLRLGLRLGAAPRLAVTTTPRPTAVLRALLAEPGLAVTRGSAVENAEWLAPGFVAGLRALYGGTRLERQEIDGEVLEALEGAVFRSAEIERARALGAAGARPARFDALVVGVDPPAGRDGAACGVVVAGRVGREAWVLEDATAWGLTPLGWAGRVAEAAARWRGAGMVTVVAEANQGGEMVRQVLDTAGVEAPVRLVHAAAGKAARAEPVALLYEQGRVAHVGGLAALEDQLLLLGAEGERGAAASPDRADALVWALTALLLERGWEGPRITVL